jgi:hypothetical protein
MQPPPCNMAHLSRKDSFYAVGHYRQRAQYLNSPLPQPNPLIHTRTHASTHTQQEELSFWPSIHASNQGECAQLATFPSYVLPRVVRMTSGARYAGVPTLDPGAELNFSCCGVTHTRTHAAGSKRGRKCKNHIGLIGVHDRWYGGGGGDAHDTHACATVAMSALFLTRCMHLR